MKTTLLLLMLFFAGTASAGDTYLFTEFGAGKNANVFGSWKGNEWEDDDGIGGFIAVGVEHEFNDNVVLAAHWTHVSQWDKGKPFEDDSVNE